VAGPSVVVRVLGDLKGLGDSFTAAGKTASGAASRIHGAFSSALGTLNSTGVLGPFGEALAGIDEAIGKVSEHGKDIGKAMLGVGGALVGIGAGLQAIGSKDQAAHQQLQAAVEATGKAYDGYEGDVEKAIKQQEKFGTTANVTQDALRTLTQATGDPKKALDLLGTAANLAAAKHEDLNTAAGQLGKTYNGATKLLKDFGVSAAPKAATATKALESATKQATAADELAQKAKQRLADLVARDQGAGKLTIAQQQALRNAQQAVTDATGKAVAAHGKLTAAQQTATLAAKGQQTTMDALSQKLSGQASAAADTFSGHLEAIKAKLEDGAAAFGQKYGPAITAAGAAMTGLGAVIETATAINDAFAASEALSLGPILLVIAAVVALGAAAYLIYRNWNTIWTAMKAIVADVWNWIKANWPLLLGILLGPIALAAALIYKYWDQIRAGIAAVINWIRANWPIIVDILLGPVGIAITQIVEHWQGFLAFFRGIPGAIAGAASGMFDSVWEAFRNVVNRIIDGWNSLHFGIPSIDTHIPGIGKIGGESVGTPHIPRLAQGGLITADGLIYAHAGEAITPAPDVGRKGPAVVVQQATFTTELDVEAFMRKAAWAAKTAGL
jgi:hypothetical protein